MNRQILPRRLVGTLMPPASKSDAHRCLILSALANKPTEIIGVERSGDIDATLGCLKNLGARFDGQVLTPGRPPETALLNCAESGTTLRLLLPIVAAMGVEGRFIGQHGLIARPNGPLLEALASHGVQFDQLALPLTLRGRLQSGQFELPGNISSLFVSGLLMAMPLLDSGGTILLTTPLESTGYVDMTLARLEDFSVLAGEAPGRFFTPGNQTFRSPKRLTVEKDWSSAAFYLVAGALGSMVTLTSLPVRSRQPDRQILDVLHAFGASVEQKPEGIRVGRGSLHGQTVDVSGMPDLVPILAVLGAGATGETRLENAARLRLKESDRLQSTSEMIRALGGWAEVQGDTLVIRGGQPLTGGTVDSYGDHRIAMAGAIAATLCSGPVTILGAECASKSYPAFWEHYQQLGGVCNVIDDR